MKLKTGKYKNIEVQFYVDEEGLFSAIALGTTHSKGIGFKTLAEAEISIKQEIDKFLETTPKTYEELADAVTENLNWTCYEQCHCEPDILKTLVENFIKYNENK